MNKFALRFFDPHTVDIWGSYIRAPKGNVFRQYARFCLNLSYRILLVGITKVLCIGCSKEGEKCAAIGSILARELTYSGFFVNYIISLHKMGGSFAWVCILRVYFVFRIR